MLRLVGLRRTTFGCIFLGAQVVERKCNRGRQRLVVQY